MWGANGSLDLSCTINNKQSDNTHWSADWLAETLAELPVLIEPIDTALPSIQSITSPLSWSTVMSWTWVRSLLCFEPPDRLLWFDLI
jgi:hypothetical protein